MKKRILTVLLALVTATSLTACGKDEPRGNDKEPTAFTTQNTTENSQTEQTLSPERQKEYDDYIKYLEEQVLELANEPEPLLEFTYEEDKFLGGIRVLHYTGVEKDIVIPDAIGGKPVVALGNQDLNSSSNFEFCEDKRVSETIESIKIPDTVVEIGADFFKNLKNLKEIKLPDSLERFGGVPFNHCESLTELTIPENVKEFKDYKNGDSILYGCKNLEIVNILCPKDEFNLDSFGLSQDENGNFLLKAGGMNGGFIPVNFVNG